MGSNDVIYGIAKAMLFNTVLNQKLVKRSKYPTNLGIIENVIWHHKSSLNVIVSDMFGIRCPLSHLE